MNRLLEPPEPKSTVGAFLLAHWTDARDAMEFHRRRAGTHGNMEMTFAAHKMQWIKELIRDYEKELK